MPQPPSKQLASNLMQFARNGRWGTCVDCPRLDHHPLPELCVNTERYDHQLDWNSLKEQVERELLRQSRVSRPPQHR